MTLYPRTAERSTVEALEVFRVAVLNGPRQSGKTTIAKRIADEGDGLWLSMDDPGTLAAARADPLTLIEGAEFVVIDEIQRAGDPLLLSIKAAVDQSNRRGQFLLTGSSNFLTVPTLSDSLAGRVGIIDIWPLSQREIRNRLDSPNLLDHLVGGAKEMRSLRPKPMRREEYFDCVCRGGYPEVQELQDRQRVRWFQSYLKTVVDREIRDLVDVRRVHEMNQFLQLLMTLSAQELNVSRLCDRVHISRETGRQYLALLSTVFAVFEVPPYSRNLTARASRRSKIHASDSAMAAAMLGTDTKSLSRPMATAAGPLLETFVAGEVMKLMADSEFTWGLYHYRDRDGAEVDLVGETSDGRTIGIEVKAAQSVDTRDFAGLRLMQQRLDTFVGGVVLYTGTQVLPFGEGLTALPISALW